MAEDLRAARVGLNIALAVAAERAELDPAVYRALEDGNVIMNMDLSTDGPLTIFIDTLGFDIRELKEQSVFVSPYHVLTLVERFGFYKTFASRQPADKRLIELWIAAVFTLWLGRDRGTTWE